MKIIDLKTNEEYILRENDRVSCAIGNFDGVHLGHRELLTLAASKRNGMTKSAVWTFEEPSSHTMDGVSLLTKPSERYALFRELGIDLLFLADFGEVRSVEPECFVREILYQQCGVRHAICGFNFRYGKMASGNAETLRASFSELGCGVTIVPAFRLNGVVVSSSQIREALANGDVERAAEMLSRPYSLTAPIVHGKQLGRKLGFPTANQAFSKERAVPKFGVYAVRIRLDGAVYEGVANVGVRPTVEDTLCANCETYLFDFKGDLYEKTATTEFCKFIRPECRFPDLETLKNTVYQDIQTAKQYFKAEREHQI